MIFVLVISLSSINIWFSFGWLAEMTTCTRLGIMTSQCSSRCLIIFLGVIGDLHSCIVYEGVIRRSPMYDSSWDVFFVFFNIRVLLLYCYIDYYCCLRICKVRNIASIIWCTDLAWVRRVKQKFVLSWMCYQCCTRLFFIFCGLCNFLRSLQGWILHDLLQSVILILNSGCLFDSQSRPALKVF